jgi:hypothetical protein
MKIHLIMIFNYDSFIISVDYAAARALPRATTWMQTHSFP